MNASKCLVFILCLKILGVVSAVGAFRSLIPDEETPTTTQKELSPPEKLPRVTSPVEPTAMQPGPRPVPRPRQTNIQVNLLIYKLKYVQKLGTVALNNKNNSKMFEIYWAIKRAN